MIEFDTWDLSLRNHVFLHFSEIFLVKITLVSQLFNVILESDASSFLNQFASIGHFRRLPRSLCITLGLTFAINARVRLLTTLTLITLIIIELIRVFLILRELANAAGRENGSSRRPILVDAC